MKLFTQFLVLSVAFTPFIHAEESRVVNIYNWSDYIDKSILKSFTEQTGIKVVYDVFDANEMLEAKLLAGHTGYDVVVPTNNFIQRQIKAGIFQKLDKSSLPNLKYISPDIQEKMKQFDPDNSYSVTYMWGTSGIGYNVDEVKRRIGKIPTNLDMLFDPEITSKLKDCGIVWSDTSDVMIPTALAYLGLNPLSTKKSDLDQAVSMMQKVRQNIRKFDASEYISDLANGDICVAAGYSGDVMQARARAIEAKNGQNITYMVPSEGGQLWFDQLAIPADAPHYQEALTFINYLMDPKIIAKASNYVAYANANTAANQYMDQEIVNNKAIYPDKEVLKKLWVQSELTNKEQRLLNRMWTKVRSGI